MFQETQKLYDTDIASIAAASSYATDSVVCGVTGSDLIAVQVIATGGNASVSGKVIAKFVGSVDGSNFDTGIYATAELQMTTNAVERATNLINVAGLQALKVTEIENTDASYTATAVNVQVGKAV